MLSRILTVGALCLALGPARGLCAEGDEVWQAAEIKKLEGRWASRREEKTDTGEVRRTRVEVEFSDRQLDLYLFYDYQPEQVFGGLKVGGVEKIDYGHGTTSRLKVDLSEWQSTGLYYDFVGEKLILIGALPWRPFEGFSLSGEYTRVEK